MNSIRKFGKALHHGLKLVVAVPLLLVFMVAAPASTRESNPIETEEVEEDEQTADTLTPLTLNWGSGGDAPPDYLNITTGLSNPKETGVWLVDAVQNVHARKMNEKLTFAEAFRELAIEVKGEIPPQFEDKGIEEANEGTPEDQDIETDRPPNRRLLRRPKGRLPK